MKTLRYLTVTKLSTATIYKLVAVGSLCSLIPLFTLMGLLSALGWGSMQWGGQPVQGWTGWLSAPLMGAAMALGLTAIGGTLLSLGLWLFSWFRPIRLSVLMDESHKHDNIN